MQSYDNWFDIDNFTGRQFRFNRDMLDMQQFINRPNSPLRAKQFEINGRNHVALCHTTKPECYVLTDSAKTMILPGPRVDFQKRKTTADSDTLEESEELRKEYPSLEGDDILDSNILRRLLECWEKDVVRYLIWYALEYFNKDTHLAFLHSYIDRCNDISKNINTHASDIFDDVPKTERYSDFLCLAKGNIDIAFNLFLVLHRQRSGFLIHKTHFLNTTIFDTLLGLHGTYNFSTLVDASRSKVLIYDSALMKRVLGGSIFEDETSMDRMTDRMCTRSSAAAAAAQTQQNPQQCIVFTVFGSPFYIEVCTDPKQTLTAKINKRRQEWNRIAQTVGSCVKTHRCCFLLREAVSGVIVTANSDLYLHLQTDLHRYFYDNGFLQTAAIFLNKSRRFYEFAVQSHEFRIWYLIAKVMEDPFNVWSDSVEINGFETAVYEIDTHTVNLNKGTHKLFDFLHLPNIYPLYKELSTLYMNFALIVLNRLRSYKSPTKREKLRSFLVHLLEQVRLIEAK